MSSSKFDEFTAKVNSKVKSKEAHTMIKNELKNHLQELSHSLQKKEFSKEEADEKAIQDMGNPFSLGENLNRIHKPRIDWILLVLFLVIAGISFLPLIGGATLNVPSIYLINRQATWYTLALLIILSVLFFDYRKLRNWWILFYGTALALLLYTSVFGIMVNGLKRWISIFGLSTDVTITLLLFLLAWAGILSKINEFHSVKKQVLLFIMFWAPILVYMMLPHIMFSIIYFISVITMLAVSNVQKKLAIKLLATNISAGLVLLVFIIASSRGGYFFQRLQVFIDPNKDPMGAGYMYLVVKDIFSRAGWFGNGLTNDLSYETLPAAHTDFIFAYLVYSLGWIFGIFLCLILLGFILRISFNAFRTPDLFGRLLVIGGAALFTVPASWNILMGFGFLPIMGVSLPFISYGGSMLLVYSFTLGLILNVYRRKDLVEATK